MKATNKHSYQYYSALHDIFSTDYQEVNQYVTEMYHRPKQFIDETGPVLDRFLREYTLPGAPRPIELPAGAVLEFIGQVNDFTSETACLFNSHKDYLDQCAHYLGRVSSLRGNGKGKIARADMEELSSLTPELIDVYDGLKKIKDKADYMAEKLSRLEERWATVKKGLNN